MAYPRTTASTRGDTEKLQHGDSHERDTVVMFADIMGASEVSNHKTPKDYAAFVEEFQKLFRSVCAEFVEVWHKDHKNSIQYGARGDEGLLMMYRAEAPYELGIDIDTAIQIALELKRRWLGSKENSKRVLEAGLLPVDLGIGIHVGRTYLQTGRGYEGNPGGARLEGYTINLAKRVESHSRSGTFSHIVLSEAAHGLLNYLADERTVLFDSPHAVSLKGISRDIRIHEIKHHFLPSDWQKGFAIKKRARVVLDVKLANPELVNEAIKLNPSNLWLTEEYIRAQLLRAYGNMTANERRDLGALRKAFAPAREVAERLSQSDLRDAGGLFISGLVEGECGNYESEREKYDDAIRYTDQLAEAYWYKGQSFSYQAYEMLQENASKTYGQVKPEIKKLADSSLECHENAVRRKPQAAWINYDYGCELIRWERTEAELQEGISRIVLAAMQFGDVSLDIPDQPYLAKVRRNPAIQRLLQ